VTGKTALITGITGQDGSYLAELLVDKGYTVHGMIRRLALSIRPGSTTCTKILTAPKLDCSCIRGPDGWVKAGDPDEHDRADEVYHLAAQSHVQVSFDEPELTGDTTGLGTTRLLEAIRMIGLERRFYQASSSQMYGSAPAPQTEETRFLPRSPYAAAKVYSYWMTRNYREAYGLFALNGILFKYESLRRGETFVTRKITRAVARISAGLQEALHRS
jgi:GDPmannose 4,6-dehydratase